MLLIAQEAVHALVHHKDKRRRMRVAVALEHMSKAYGISLEKLQRYYNGQLGSTRRMKARRS